MGLLARILNSRTYQYQSFLNTLVDGELNKSDKDIQEQREIKWSVTDQKNRNTVIQVVGYDPFEDYTDDNRKFLHAELCKYLDDDIVDDPFKVANILQVVINNNQIRQYDLEISRLNPTVDAKDIQTLNAIKKNLVDSNDKIAKENEISVRNRSNKEVGRNTFTFLQRKLRDLDFEKAEVDYYDQLQSPGTYWAAQMSDKAIREHAMFDENDKQEIFLLQREMIQKLQKQLDDAQEANRQLLIKVDALENGNGGVGDE
jgi:hypothetical protein